MNTDYKNVMSKETDEQLIKIVFLEGEGYQPMAVEAAREEIKKRNIETLRINEVVFDFSTKIEKQKQLEEKQVSALTRFIHFIVDTIVFFIFTLILGITIGLFINIRDQTLMALLNFLLLLGGYFIYYVFMETKYQKTVGKFMTKTSVVTKDGTKPEIGDIIRRTFFRIIPFDSVSFLFSSNGLHDRLSDTTIIKDEN